MSNRSILLIIGGGIAAYKALDLIRRLKERDIAVRVVLTQAARQFVTPLSVASLSGEKVHDDLFSLTGEAEMGHIELSRSADLVVIAPATADLLAKVANGLADDLASTLLLATDKQVLAAPAMNLRMWLHPATRRNVARLREDGMLFTGPDDGAMACGEFGPGRMSEPLAIVAAVEAALQGDTAIPLPPGLVAAACHPREGGDPAMPWNVTAGELDPRLRGDGRSGQMLAGKRVLVTSGPTHEPIDPVRYIANRSSGKQGHAIALAAAQAGAQVVLVSGPVSIPDPEGVATHHVETARDMLAAVQIALPADIFICAAAVADWRVAETGGQKLKKEAAGTPAFHLVENPDILATVAHMAQGRPPLVVGFAAETEHVLQHARKKLARKGCDLIVANDVGAGAGVMGGAHNTVHLVTAAGTEDWPLLDKNEVARRLVGKLAAMLGENSN